MRELSIKTVISTSSESWQDAFNADIEEALKIDSLTALRFGGVEDDAQVVALRRELKNHSFDFSSAESAT